jgi:hypothetical protein
MDVPSELPLKKEFCVTKTMNYMAPNDKRFLMSNKLDKHKFEELEQILKEKNPD